MHPTFYILLPVNLISSIFVQKKVYQYLLELKQSCSYQPIFCLHLGFSNSNHMNENKKRSFLSSIPSWGLAGITLVATFILMTILMILGDLMRIDENIGEPFFYIFFGVFIAVCCFFIVRRNPGSIRYVPIICNLIGIISAIIEPTFWVTSLWIFIGIGWLLSIIASVIGYFVGRRQKVSSSEKII